MNFARRTLRDAAVVLMIVCAPVFAREVSVQKNTDRGVTLTVTPLNIASDSKIWSFRVILDTHSENLTDDLQRSAVLVAPNNQQQPAIAWEGTPPGGHHREGVLRFNALSPVPDAIDLRIKRPNESAPRSFRWSLK